ncbi:MAG: tRNA-dihydrouridine synthase family protein [Bacteroidales bacterium]
MTTEKKLKIHFAPLQGHTDHFYRNAHQEIFGGIDTYYTPFVRLEKGNKYRTRELRDILPENNRVHELVPQMIASTPEELKEIASLFIKNGYKRADLNMGCPFPMIARRHKGSGLLPHVEEVKALMDAIREIPELQFSVKMRLGWESAQECLDLLPILNDAPLVHIGLHARLGKQQYKGEVDMEGFEAFYKACKHPLFYNGDLLSIEDIEQIQNRFPNLEGVMIGRGLLSNPALALEYSQDKTLEPLDKKKRMREFHNTLFEHYSEFLQGDKQILEKMKPFWEYLSNEMEKRTRKKIEKANKIAHYEAAVSLAFSQWGKISFVSEEESDEE